MRVLREPCRCSLAVLLDVLRERCPGVRVEVDGASALGRLGVGLPDEAALDLHDQLIDGDALCRGVDCRERQAAYLLGPHAG